MTIRLVTWDILHTIITPRWPIHVQYSMAFEPYVGKLEPASIKQSFKTALKALQKEKPAYEQGSQAWWADVVQRTALGAGADPHTLDASLGNIVPGLMHRFSSGEGYRAFDDAIPTIRALHQHQIRTAVEAVQDILIHTGSVLIDLEFPDLTPIVLSEEEGIEKPLQTHIRPEECLHIGDDLDADYHGALNTGMKALLLRRPGPDGEEARVEENEDLNGVTVIQGLDEVLHYVEQYSR